MKLSEMAKEELEQLSYTDLTYMLLKENKQPMNTPTLFRKICDLLGQDDDYYAEAIGDYYTSLTIDKRFVLLENNEWDISDHHSMAITLDEEEDDDDEIIDDDSEEIDDEIDENEDEFDDILDDELDDDIDEEDEDLGLDGLTILPDKELEE
ncbi:MAG: DNA-directed RNA polymerase subunit delta [Mollicutes bacterium]|nr:DNA-directed RNA polymerase subunit delta [Mollicutes bacterium]